MAEIVPFPYEIKRLWTLLEGAMEARVGIEPAYTALQAAA